MFEPCLIPGPASDRTGAVVRGLLVKYAAPDNVTSGPVTDVDPAPQIASNFADHNRTYPLHTPAAAWASAAHYHASGSSDPLVAGRIKAACDYHRLWGEWDRLEKQARPAPVDDTPKHYALAKQAKYPLDTEGQIRKAIDYFIDNAHKIPIGERMEYTTKVVKRAEELRLKVDPDKLRRLETEAGLAKLAPNWKYAFEIRYKLAKDEKLKTALKQAAEKPPNNIPEAADLLRQLDRLNKWSIDDPLATLSGDTLSEVRSKLATVVEAADGSWYKKADLNRLPDKLLHELLGTPIVVSSNSRVDLLQDKTKSSSFRQLLADQGVLPVEQPRRPGVDWAALAAGGSGK